MTIPRILIAAVQSGSGKTTLTIGLTAALRRSGFKVQTFKVGPDFLDPSYLAKASGRPCYNLDGWMCGKEYVTQRFARACQDADVAVVEGVMGLFDGAESDGVAGSSAEIAAWLQAPVLLVVDSHGMARSIAPVVAGFNAFDARLRIGGVIANRCGSANHRAILEEALRSAGLPDLMGAVAPKAFPELRHRHLGLVTAQFDPQYSEQALATFADAAETHLALDRIVALARSAPPLVDRLTSAAPATSPPVMCLGVARDRAFHFYYADLFEELATRGCRVAWFSPLADGDLPGGLDALYLGGGYPELFAAELSKNTTMLTAIRAFAASGRPIYAECGGLIYLCQAIATLEGQRYPLLGLLPAEARMGARRKRLGYVEVTLTQESHWGGPGERLRGHEFHYSELLSDPSVEAGWAAIYRRARRNGQPAAPEGYYHQERRILASYVHLHLAGRPAALDHFIAFCAGADRSGSGTPAPGQRSHTA
jgi:cobyrinic acid a,c-diamide synthase